MWLLDFFFFYLLFHFLVLNLVIWQGLDHLQRLIERVSSGVWGPISADCPISLISPQTAALRGFGLGLPNAAAWGGLLPQGGVVLMKPRITLALRKSLTSMAYAPLSPAPSPVPDLQVLCKYLMNECMVPEPTNIFHMRCQ